MDLPDYLMYGSMFIIFFHLCVVIQAIFGAINARSDRKLDDSDDRARRKQDK